jgi:hypothetical protein
MWFPDSLRGRLVLSLAAGAAAVLTLSFLGVHLVIRGELYANLDQQLSLRMSAVAAYAAAHPGSESIAEVMPRFRTRAHQDFFQIWDGKGKTLARSDSSAGRDLPRLDAVIGKRTYFDLRLPDGHHGRAVAQAFPGVVPRPGSEAFRARQGSGTRPGGPENQVCLSEGHQRQLGVQAGGG